MIRPKLIPKGVFGCELAPINEAAMRTFRAAIVSCLTFATSKRSVDLTFSTASKWNDVDPDIVVVCRRAAAMRRAIATDEGARKMMDENPEEYRERRNQAFFHHRG